jgi:PAS domain S-box-containing protein
MSETDSLLELARVLEENEQLRRRADDAEQALLALARGEVDAVSLDAAATPILLRAAQEGLRRSEQLWRRVFHGALDAIVLSNDSFHCIDVNEAACELFQVADAQQMGQCLAHLGATGAVFERWYRDFRQHGQMRGSFKLKRPDGSERTLEYSAVADVSPGVNLSVFRNVTDRITAEEALRRSEARFRVMIEKSTEVISLTSADGTTRYVSPSGWKLLGFTPGEEGAEPLGRHVVAEDLQRLKADVARLVSAGQRDMSAEFGVYHRDGSLRWIDATFTNLLDDPDVAALVGNYRDVTARKLAEEALLANRNALEQAQAIAHVGSFSSGIHPEDEIHWSRETCRIFGVPEGTAMTVQSLFARVHPADREALRLAERNAIENDLPIDVEHRVERPDGRLCWVRVRASVERATVVGPPRMTGTVQDVTDQHLALEALRASEERYRRIVETTVEGVFTYDADNVITFVNGRMAEMLRCAVEEAVGQSVFAFIDGASREDAERRIGRRKRGIEERSDFRFRRKDGTDLWASAQATAFFDGEGRFAGAVAMVTDISEQRLARELQARLAAIVESSEDAILSASLDGVITSWNAGAERLYGYSAAEMIGQSLSLLSPPGVSDDERSTLEQVARGEAVPPRETMRRRKDGSTIDVGLTVSPIRDAAGTIIGASKIARDLTARKQAEAALRRTEEQFRQAQKMEAVGRLAGGVAHDFNNLLSVILSYAELSVGVLRTGDPMREDIEEIRLAADRATGLTRQLLAFSRQQVLQPRVLDLNDTLKAMERMLGRLLGEDIELTWLTPPHLGRVLADAGQIEQVVMNLAVNARDAMPHGGKLTIETDNVEVDAGYAGAAVGVTGSIPPGDYVMLAVCDTGVGMDAATRSRIFEPFFTTKETGKGTGLGLATVFGIVQQSGGYVGVYSEPGQGSTFKVYLPRTDRTVEAAPSSKPTSVLRGSETILLVEDEDQLRTVARNILRRNGYNVLEGSNGGEAFLISKDFPAEIHLLLTDVVMPRMSGRKLAEHLALDRPAMKVLYVSGYTDDAIVHHGILNAGVEFLQKPFTPVALLRRVREVLDALPLQARGSG